MMQKELMSLFDEVRLTFNTLATITDALHQAEGITVGMRAVMEFIEKNGAHTVPEIARARGVTRQRIQILANDLVEKDFAVLLENPTHKRSAKLDLSQKGQAAMKRMAKHEADLLDNQRWDLKKSKICETADTLKQIRSVLQQIET